MDHPNPYAGHDPDANPDLLRALRKNQKRLLREVERLEIAKGRLEARLTRTYAALSEVTVQVGELTHPDRAGRGIALAEKSVRAELAVRLRVSDRSIAGRMGQAQTVASIPVLMNAFSRGKIGSGHVWAITRAMDPITEQKLLDEFIDRTVEYATTHSVSRTKQFAKRLAERLADTTLEERHERAMSSRRVWVEPDIDGMAQLCVYTTAPIAHAVAKRLQELAKAVDEHHRQEAPESEQVPSMRSRGNLSVDIATDLLLTGTPTAASTGNVPQELLGGVKAEIQLVMPALTLLPKPIRERLRTIPALQEIAGMTGSPELPGFGPISDEVARLFALAAAGWDEAIIHPEHARVLTVERYTPSKAQVRFIRARDQHCRFPGCIAPVKRSEIDHTKEWANGGKTATDNLAVACVLHHTLKHHQIHDHYRWQVAQDHEGTLTWRSPFGTVRDDEPTIHLMFEPMPQITTNARSGDRAGNRDDGGDPPPPF